MVAYMDKINFSQATGNISQEQERSKQKKKSQIEVLDTEDSEMR
jgi:hypothetical protein